MTQHQASDDYSQKGVEVFSRFEYESHLSRSQKKNSFQRLVSNSLWVKKIWIENYHGRGRLPSAVGQDKGEGAKPVIAIAREDLSEVIWRQVLRFSM